MRKSIVYLLLLHFNIGIITPIVLLHYDMLDHTEVFITSEKEQETGEEEFEQTVFFNQQFSFKKDQASTSIRFFWKPNPYKEVFLSKLYAPPQSLV